MSFITSPGVIVPPLTAGGVAYGTGSQAKVTSAGAAGGVLYSTGAGVPGFTAAGTVGQVLTSAGAGVPVFASAAASGYTLATAVAVSGSAAIQFTSLPAGIKNIIVTFYRVSMGVGAGSIYLELGNSGGYVTGTTQSQNIRLRDPAAGSFSFVTSTFDSYVVGAGSASDFYSGSIILTLADSTNNYWTMQSSVGTTVSSAIYLSTSTINLGGILTKLQILSDANFDSGSLNIAYI